MRDFTNTYDAFMHCDVNKLAEAFASMYHSEGEDCDRLGCAKQEVNEAFMRMKTITPKVETNQSILLVCKDFGDTGDDVSLIKAKDLSVWKEKHKEKTETISDEMLTFMSTDDIMDAAMQQELPTRYAIELCSWDEILGWKLAPSSIYIYGLEFCLSRVLWEMTFFGIEPHGVEQAKADLDASIEESKKNLDENAKVVNFIADHKDTVHLVLGNHEYEHRQMLWYYKSLAQSPTVRKLAAWVFLHYKQGEHIFRTKEELEGLRCSLEERKKILASRPHTFEGWQKMFITYTLAWESDNLWKIVLYILDNMCGAPYNAEHTIYEFLMGTKKTRENFEVVFENNTQELNITPSTTEKFKQVVITHNNPFGKVNDYDKAEMLPDHQNTLYIFGHIPHKEIVRIDRPNSNCTYLDIDTSIESVSVIKLSDYLR